MLSTWRPIPGCCWQPRRCLSKISPMSVCQRPPNHHRIRDGSFIPTSGHHRGKPGLPSWAMSCHPSVQSCPTGARHLQSIEVPWSRRPASNGRTKPPAMRRAPGGRVRARLHLAGEELLGAIAIEMAQHIQKNLRDARSELRAIEQRRHAVEAQCAAANGTLERLNRFRPEIRGSYQCPKCWGEKEIQSSLSKIGGTSFTTFSDVVAAALRPLCRFDRTRN
jgi:hypothetical protein